LGNFGARRTSGPWVKVTGGLGGKGRGLLNVNLWLDLKRNLEEGIQESEIQGEKMVKVLKE